MDADRYRIVRGKPWDGVTYWLLDARTGETLKASDSVAALVKYALNAYGAYVYPPL